MLITAHEVATTMTTTVYEQREQCERRAWASAEQQFGWDDDVTAVPYDWTPTSVTRRPPCVPGITSRITQRLAAAAIATFHRKQLE